MKSCATSVFEPMKILLDTHIFLWWTQNDSRLQSVHRDAIRLPENQIYVSAASAWEIGIKRKIGKLAFAGSIADAIAKYRFEALAISVEHAETAGSLPAIHTDPFDRLLVAQTYLESITLVTVDEQILRYQVPHL
ncbi:type II toxin-antitoxin system VapC family toxin [Acidicapsa acidisoli]|uniref:type II toxin-antitoxin system VapC family toxin n=1 Tax=Acidicapsa acidisoli TaxID=1615681 RepID=UPI0021DFE18B|nr:type II toxin-antitoxin system VapC family toxin [Acidicapsa acidisoli]